MKRLLTLLSSLLLTVGILSAQSIPVVVTGTVSGTDGIGISNLPIDISADSFNFIYSNQVFTDANGFYGDTIFYPTNLGFGILSVQTVDCDGTSLGNIVLFETNDPVSQVIDLLYCDTLGGGWPPIDSCFVQVTCDPDGNLVAYAFGVAPYTYLWNTNETTQTIMPQDTGLFCVTITDANGCTSVGCSHYVGNPGGNSSCIAFIFSDLDGTLIADGLGIGPHTYLWSTGETTQIINVQNDGEYCVTIIDADSCIAQACIDFIFFPGWNDTCAVYVTCDPMGNLVSDAYGTAPFTYLWNTGETTQQIMPQDTGLFCVTVTDAEGCISEGCSHYVGNPGPIDTCGVWVDQWNPNELFANGFGSPPFTYLWSNGATTQSIIVTDSLEYCVTMTDGNGCVSTGCAISIVTPPDPCEVTIEQVGEDLIANFTGTLGVVYEWSTGETTQSITPTTTGLYCVIIYDLDGCFAEACYLFDDGTPGDTICSVMVQYVEDLGGYFAAATGAEPFTYLWDDGSTDPFLFTNDPTIHCVTVIDANGCITMACSDQINPGPTENDISGYIYTIDSSAQFPLFVGGTVSLIDSETGTTVATTDIVNLDGFPFYNFTDLADGKYIVRADALKPDGTPFIPTYHFATALSTEADVITIPYVALPAVWNSFDVFIFDIVQRPGQGSISGAVTKVPGFGGIIDHGRLTLDGISILLFDDNKEPLQYVKTNESGEFGFPSLTWGTYHVYIDVPGHENAFITVILGPSSSEVNDLNFNIYEGDISTSSSASGVKDLNYVTNVKLFPNPTFTSTTIEITSAESGKVNLNIADVSGKILQTQVLNVSKATQRFEINLETLNSGLYFVRLIDGNQSIAKRLIIK